MLTEILITLVGYAISLITTIAVIKTEIKYLRKDVDKHNSVIERTYKIEKDIEHISTELSTTKNVLYRHINNKHK